MSALEGASRYLNNLLLARGLLQNGKPIDFAHPKDKTDNADATMSKIINLVHDLVLRRDRDAEQREIMVETIRNMKMEESQRVLDFQRMQDKNIHLKNKAAAAEAQERALRDDTRRLEAQVRELKEQALKMKSMMDQVRAKCVGDVKKRDTEIEKLRSHIAGLQRGDRKASGAKTNIGSNQLSGSAGRDWRRAPDVNSKDWSLEKETNDLLTAVVNETTTENVSLRKLVSETIETLKSLTGLDEASEPEESDGIGIPGQYRASRQRAAESAQAESLIPCQTLGQQLNTVLDHCRLILKDPSFVPIEEVQIREEEIAKLRAGWEKMADRWKEAVLMMAQWKQRMHEDGRPDVEEWSDLSFDRSVAVRPDGQPILGQDHDTSSIFDQSRLIQQEEPESADPQPESLEVGPASPSVDEESDLELELEPPRKRIASSPARRGIRLSRPTKPLSEVNGNSSRLGMSSQKSRSRFSQIDSENSEDMASGTFHNHKARSKISKVVAAIPNLACADTCQSPSDFTISEKLAAVEAEAEEACEELNERAMSKRKATTTRKGSQKSSRRRSTLSPEELATLMNNR